MFQSKKIKELEKRIEYLERCAVVSTWHYDKLDLEKLARIVDDHISRSTSPAVTDDVRKKLL